MTAVDKATRAGALSDVRSALDRATNRLLDLQHSGGWWKGELETNVTMDAEDLLMRQFLGVRTDDQTQQSARWIRRQQREDGSWANFASGPADPSTTAEAYVALRLAGDDPGSAHMRTAQRIVLSHGGLKHTRVFTKIWLALFGLWKWDDVPALPPELIFMPSSMPLNLYDFACWARQTIAPLTVLAALRPRRDLGITIDELRGDQHDAAEPGGTGMAGNGLADRAFGLLDTMLHRYERLPRHPVRRTALRRMVDWIADRQEADGSWGGIQPPWVYSLMALNAYGYPLDHPVIATGLTGWERFTIVEKSPDGPLRRIEACQSPVWDTALALIALGDCGVSPSAEAVTRASDWLCMEEIRRRGDWSKRRPGAPAGGWAFEFDNDNYPDIDDTAEIVMALAKATGSPARDAAARRGVAWVARMQSRDGGWAAFDADNTRTLAYRLPFSDFGAVIDPPSADVTAHVVEMLARRGTEPTAMQRGVHWLLRHQEADGSWYGRWGANHIYGIGAVVPALITARISPGHAAIRRAIRWLRAHQNPDGGWGEDLRSYTDDSWIGRGESTPSQTAWALLAFHAADECDDESARRGIAWLLEFQNDDGGWDEPFFTGTGFPGDFYIDYHLYRLVFPVMALGRFAIRGGAR